MKITVHVKPGAKKRSIEQQSDGTLTVKVKEPAKEGRANEAVLEAVAEYFDIPKNSLVIVRGRSSRHKLIQVSL